MQKTSGTRLAARASAYAAGTVSTDNAPRPNGRARGLSPFGLLLLGTSLAALCTAPALAAIDDWNGSVSVNWSNGNNWVSGNEPATDDAIVISQPSAGKAPSDFDISGLTITSLTLGTTTNTTTNASGYVIYSTVGPLGLTSGGSITDNATNAVSDQINTGIELNGPATITVSSGATGLIIGGDGTSAEGIVGTGGLTVSNSGTNPLMFLSNNTYSGGTTISAGTLQLGDGGTTGSIVGNVDNKGTLVFDRSDSFSFSGNITDTGALVQAGTGTLTLTGTNNYSGGTKIESGAISIASDSNIGTGTIAMSTQTTLYVTATNTFTNTVTLAGTTAFNIASGTTTTWSGLIEDGATAGTLDQLGTGTLVLLNNDTYTGGTFVNGTLQIGNGGSSGSVSNSGGIDLSTGATVAFDRSGSYTYGGNIIGGGHLVQKGSGTLILTGTVDPGEDTTISSGTLQIGNGGATGTLIGNVINNSALAFDLSGSTNYSGSITGTGSITQAGAGTLTLSGTNSGSSGNIYVNTGALSVSSASNLSTGSLNLADGTTLDVTATGSFSNATTLAGSTTINVASSTATTWSGEIDDGGSAGSLEITGGGTFTPTNTSNSYSGGTIVAGGSTLVLSADGELGNSIGGLELGDATTKGTLDVTTGFTLDATRAMAINAGGGEIDVAGSDVFEVTQGITGAGGLTVGGTGTLELTGASSYAGTTISSGATLQLGDGTNAGSVTGNIADNGSLVFDEGNDVTVSNVISGSGSLTQNDSAGQTLTLSGANTFTGGITVSDGTLSVTTGGTSGTNLGANAVTLAGGTLLANGTGNVISNAITLGTGGGTINVADGDSDTFSGAIGGTTGLTLNSNTTGTIILSGGNSFSGGVVVDGGVVSVTTGGTSGSNLGANAVTLNGATLLANGNNQTISNAIAIGIAGGVVNVVNGSSDTFSGVISGNHGVIINSTTTGTVVLSGANTVTGGIVVDGGTVSVTTGGTSGSNLSSGQVTLAGATLLANGTGNVISNAITLFTGGGTINVANGNSDTFSGVISGSTGLVVNSNTTGTEILSGANSFTGGVAVDGGILSVTTGGTSGTNLGTNAVTLNGATLLVNGSGNTISNAITVGTGGGTLNVASGDSDTFSGIVGGTTGLIVNNGTTGTAILSGANTFTGGVTVDGGVLSVTTGGASGSNLGTSAVTLNGATLLANGTGNTISNALTVGTGGGTINVANAESDTFSGIIGGTTGLTVNNGTTGTVTLSGANTFTGGVSVDGGVLSATTGGATGSNLGTGTVTLNGATLLANGTGNTISNALTVGTGGGTINVGGGSTDTFSGTIGGSTGLTVNNGTTGTVILSAANNYPGGTTVDGGTLSIAASNNLGAGTVALNGASLLVTGTANTITNAVTVGTGGGTINVANGETDTFSGVIGGSTGLTLNNGTGGTIVLSGDNVYSGGTTVDGGTISVSAGDNLGAGTVTLADSTLLVTGTGTTITNAIALSTGGGTINVGTGDSDTFSGAIGGTTALTVNSGTTGTAIFSGANTYSGGTTVDGGTLSITTGGASGSNLGTGGVTLNDATLLLNGTGNTISNAITLGTGGGTINAVNGSTNMLSGAIGGTTGLTVNNGTTGTVIVTAADSYSGGTTIDGGTFQVGNGGTTGSIGGNVADAGTLAFDLSSNVGFAGNVSGGGVLTQSGSGVLTLSGTNTYSGGTNVNAGTLSVSSASNIGSGTLAMAAGTTLDVTATASFANAATLTGDPTFNVAPNTTTTWSGVISDGASAGTLELSGGGTLILTANNTYTGGTTINAGTLQIGSGSTTGAILGNVADSGTLAFDLSGTTAFAGNITGTGAVTQMGTGTLTLSGTNNYSGGTNIDAGAVSVASDANIGTGTIAMTSGTALNITADGTYANAATLAGDATISVTSGATATWNGVISDGASAGTLDTSGGGTLILTAVDPYSGGTHVGAGTLLVNGSLTHSTVSVASGGTIGGTGTIGALTVTNGGVVAPGSNGIGTLNVNGSITLAAGSTYAYDVTPTTHDELIATGTATLNGTLLVNPIGLGTGTTLNVPVVSAAGGLNGNFSSVIFVGGGPSGLIPLVTDRGNTAYLNFLSTAALVSSSAPGNQGRVGGAVDFAIVHDNAIALVPITTLSGTALTTTLAEMSGEVATGAQNVAVQSLTSFLDMMLDPSIGGRGGLGDGGNDVLASNQPGTRLAYNGPDSSMPYEHQSQRAWTVWGTFDGGGSNDNGNAVLQSHAMRTSQAGGALGLDYRPANGNGALGIALGLNQENWNVSEGLGHGAASAYQVGVYYSRRWDEFYFSSGFAYSQYRATTDRSLDFNSATDYYHAGFNPWSEALRAEFGNDFHLSTGVLYPYVRFQAEDLGVPNYAETTLTGSDPSFALSYTAKEQFDYNTELGTGWTVSLANEKNGATDLHARLGWVHDFEGNLDVTSTFSEFNGASFTVTGARPPRDAAHLELGIEQDLGVVALTLNAQGLIGGTGDSYGGTAAVSYRW